MSRDNIKELIKLEYENGATMVFLSNKYNVSVGTIKTWSFTNKWVKKKPNIKTKTNKKTNCFLHENKWEPQELVLF